MEAFHILLGIFILYILYKSIETLQNDTTKEMIKHIPCNNCNIWNHVDAKTKCQKTCQKDDPDYPYDFTGKWQTNIKKPQDSICECSRIGHLTQHYIGCPLGTKLDDNKPDCFIWNDNEAQSTCPQMCNQYLPNKNAVWTGNWKSTSAGSSASECKYYK